MRFLILLIFPAFAFGHVTENEMLIIEKMRAASADQQVLLQESIKETEQSRKVIAEAVQGLNGVSQMAEQTKAALSALQEQSDAIARAAQDAQKRADEADTKIARQTTTILKLGILSSVLGVISLGLLYLLFKP